MSISVYLISTGTELTLGKSIDTNSGWIANQLLEFGLKIKKILVLPDDLDLIKSEINSIAQIDQEQLIIMTGGLGATEDDYTLQAICDLVDQKAIEIKEAVEKLEKFVALRGKTYQDLLPKSKRQTMIPENAYPFINHAGYATGFWIALNSHTNFVAFPGVPREMMNMFERSFLPKLKQSYTLSAIHYYSTSIWGVGEMIFQEKFIVPNRDWISQCEWGVTARSGHVKVSFRSHDLALLDKIKKEIHIVFEDKICDDVYSELHNLLIDQNKTIATAESCTSGLLAKLLTDRSGSSAYFLGGIVSYHNDVKQKLLSVEKDTLLSVGAVSKETASQMVRGVIGQISSDYAVSITGIAGPTGDTMNKKVGQVFVGIGANGKEPIVHELYFPLERDIFRNYIANYALFLLHKYIKEDLQVK